MGAAADVFGFVVRQRNCGGGVWWDRDGEAVCALLPVGDDGAVGGVVLGVELGERRVEVRVDGEVMEAGAGLAGVAAGGALVATGHDRAEGVVVVGVHGGVAGVAVPALPPGGCTFLHHVAPGGVGVGEEKFVGEVGTIVFVEHKHEEGSAEEAGAEMVAVGLNVFREAIDHIRAKRRLSYAGEEGGGVCGLGVSFDAAILFYESGAVGGGDVVVLLLVLLGICGAMEGCRHLHPLAGDECPIGSIDECFGSILIGGEPVCVVVADGVATDVVGVVAEDEVHPALHRRPGAFDDGGVPVFQPRGMRDEDTCIAPAGGSWIGAEDVG